MVDFTTKDHSEQGFMFLSLIEFDLKKDALR
jgi:hypothetical protein